MLAAISNLFRALAEGLGFVRERSAAKNTVAMQANAQAQTDAEIDRRIADADARAAKGDLSAVRNLNASE